MVTVGEAVTVAPVVAESPVPDQVKLVAPVAVNVVLPPAHIEVGEAVTCTSPPMLVSVMELDVGGIGAEQPVVM